MDPLAGTDRVSHVFNFQAGPLRHLFHLFERKSGVFKSQQAPFKNLALC
jgi:hypothetical protein